MLDAADTIRPRHARLFVGLLVIVAVTAAGVVGFLVYRSQRVPDSSEVCEHLSALRERGEPLDAYVSPLAIGDEAPRGESFTDRCVWMHDALRRVNGDASYGKLARCTLDANSYDDVLRCSFL